MGVLGYMVLPGFTVHGMDVGKWLARQRTPAAWQGLAEEQRERLEQLGITALAPEPEAPATAPTAAVSASQKGVAAFAQYKTRTGSVTVPRSHVETVVVHGQEHAVKLGVFLSNSKSRRARLTADQLAQLAALGLNWA
ncbi:helicase associated domain-containing protein [Streptomyces sp. NPDC005195]|uniref:helicase associated domain-containing protein n=1 Tax=Streptomyces sp. NPDC005195 TaxID=3154561 RepID=UPI0033AFBEC6